MSTAAAPRITTILEELARPTRDAIFQRHVYDIAPPNPEVLREMMIDHLTENFPRSPFLFPLLRHLFQIDPVKLAAHSILILELPAQAVRITFNNTTAPPTATPLLYTIPDLSQPPPAWLAPPPSVWSRLFGRI